MKLWNRFVVTRLDTIEREKGETAQGNPTFRYRFKPQFGAIRTWNGTHLYLGFVSVRKLRDYEREPADEG